MAEKVAQAFIDLSRALDYQYEHCTDKDMVMDKNDYEQLAVGSGSSDYFTIVKADVEQNENSTMFAKPDSKCSVQKTTESTNVVDADDNFSINDDYNADFELQYAGSGGSKQSVSSEKACTTVAQISTRCLNSFEISNATVTDSNRDYLVVIDDTRATFKSKTNTTSAEYLVPFHETSKPSPAASINNAYLHVIKKSCVSSTKRNIESSEDYLKPVDQAEPSSTIAQLEYMVAEGNSGHEYITVVDDDKYYSVASAGEPITGDTSYSRLLHKQADEQAEYNRTYDNSIDTATNYDNNVERVNSNNTSPPLESTSAASVSVGVVYGQRRDSIYDQLDDTLVYSDIADETAIYSDIADDTAIYSDIVDETAIYNDIINYDGSINYADTANGPHQAEANAFENFNQSVQDDKRGCKVTWLSSRALILQLIIIVFIAAAVTFTRLLNVPDTLDNLEHQNDEQEKQKTNLTSMTYKSMITVKNFRDGGTSKMLSVSKETHQLLIVGQIDDNSIHIYNTTAGNNSFIKFTTLPNNDKLAFDAAWTPAGHIAYTTTEKVVVISLNGDVIAQTGMQNTRHLSVSNDNVMYLADFNRGVYQSSYGGVNWTFVFNASDGQPYEPGELEGWSMMQAIKVASEHDLVCLWTFEMDGFAQRRLRIYKIRPSDNVITAITNITAPKNGSEVLYTNKLDYDGLSTIFLIFWDTSILFLYDATSGDYRRQVDVMQPSYISADNYPMCSTIDRHSSGNHALMYIGHKYNGIVSVHTLTYE